MRSELRVRIHDAADAVWRALVADRRRISDDAVGEFSRTRGPEFKQVIEYDNKQLQEELLPAYRSMANLFREQLWLADSDTRDHYQNLIEFIELWDRWLARSIPGEVLERLGHSEDKLKPFYEHLQRRHDDLRAKIETGKV